MLRTADAASAVAASERLVGVGLQVVELTATTPDWPEAARSLRRDHHDLVLGLGTVRDADTARRAADLGLDFLVSPHLVPDVRASTDLLLVEGAWSPTELSAASAHGLAKLFPAHVGGPAHLRSVRAVLPGAAIVPTGGIEPEDTESWLDAGALAVGLGTSLLARLDRDPAWVDDWLAALLERRAS